MRYAKNEDKFGGIVRPKLVPKFKHYMNVIKVNFDT